MSYEKGNHCSDKKEELLILGREVYTEHSWKESLYLLFEKMSYEKENHCSYKKEELLIFGTRSLSWTLLKNKIYFVLKVANEVCRKESFYRHKFFKRENFLRGDTQAANEDRL